MTIDLDYKSFRTKPLPRKTAGRALWAFAILLAVIVSYTIIRIEILNHKAGGVLQRKVAEGYTGKWRWFMWDNDQDWHQMFGPKDADGKPVTRPLTASETAKMKQSVSRIRARNALRGVISSLGLLNYLLVPLLFILSMTLWIRVKRRKEKYAATALLGIAVGSGFLMIYHGYYTSLGW